MTKLQRIIRTLNVYQDEVIKELGNYSSYTYSFLAQNIVEFSMYVNKHDTLQELHVNNFRRYLRNIVDIMKDGEDLELFKRLLKDVEGIIHIDKCHQFNDLKMELYSDDENFRLDVSVAHPTTLDREQATELYDYLKLILNK